MLESEAAGLRLNGKAARRVLKMLPCKIFVDITQSTLGQRCILQVAVFSNAF